MSEQRVVQRAAPSSDSSALASSTSTPSNVQPHKPTSTPVIAGTLAGCILVIACVLTFILIRKRRRRLLAEYASHFAAAAERTNFPREHPDKGGTLGKYTAQELPPRSHESSASSSGSSPALPSVHNPFPLQQQSQRHDPIISNRDNGSPDHELQSLRSRLGSSPDIPPGSSLPPVYQQTITTSQQPQQPNPNSTARLYPAALSGTRPHSDLAGRRPHGHTDAVADLGSQEDDNNTNNNSHTLHSTSGAHNSAISGYVRHHSGVGRPRREDISEGFSRGGANAGVSPVTEDEIVGYRGEPSPPLLPLNSGGGGGGSGSGAGGEFGESRGRTLPSSVPSTEIGRHTSERDYLEDGRRWQGTTLGTSTSVPGLEYPYSGSGAGGPPPNEDVSSSPSAPRRSGGGGPSTIIPPPPSSATTPVSSRVPSRDAQQQHYTTALSLLPPPPHTSFSPTSRTHAHTHISDGMGGIPIREEEEDAPPAYENIWPSARPEELRRAELRQLQQGRE